MRRLRFALAVAAVALAAGSPNTAVADGSCRNLLKDSETGVVCSYTGYGACPNCEYDCTDGSTPTWNTCGMQE